MARCQAEELAGTKEHKGSTVAVLHGQSYLPSEAAGLEPPPALSPLCPASE